MGIFNSLLLDHKELEDKTKVQPRDYVYFFSRAGGWGFGHVVQAKKKLKENEVCVLKTGRSKPEVVKMSDIQHAFRENADQQL